MIPYHILTVPLNQIEITDLRYRISTGSLTDALLASIRDMGMIAPPCLLEQDGEYIVISGFKRIAACRHLKMEKIPAMIPHGEASVIQCAKIAITANTSQRSLNLLEQARAYSLLQSCIESDTELTQTAALVGLSNPLEMIKKIARIAQSPCALQEGIQSEAVSMAMALELMAFPEDLADLFATFFKAFRPGLNRQREFITLIREIAVKEEVTPSDIFKCEPVKAILEDGKKDNPQKLNQLRYYLRQRRFPELSRKEQQIEKLIRLIHPGKGVKITPPPFFESCQYTLQFTFSSMSQLKSHENDVQRLIENPHTPSLFE